MLADLLAIVTDNASRMGQATQVALVLAAWIALGGLVVAWMERGR